MTELDGTTLRVAFGVVALTMLMLFFFVTYRTTRSGYSGWWCLALTWFLGGSAAFLLNGTDQQQWANPLGNALLVLGAGSAWAASRSLGGSATRLWQLLAAPLVTGAVSLADDPATDVWAGGTVFLASMSLMFGLSARELMLIERGYTRVRSSVVLAAGLICLYYVGRLIAILAVGPGGSVFTTYFGSVATTLITMVTLVAVSFSMSVLSNEQSTRELTRRATTDGLTELLNRTEFLDLATAATRIGERQGTSGAMILADLDNFKQINDTYGHPAGDHVLRAFAAACRRTVRSTDLVGRFGGEEFILLLPGTSLDRAEQVTEEISLQLRSAPGPGGFVMPTVSYGIVRTDPGVALEETIASADSALYRAKVLGRNRAVREDRYSQTGTEAEQAFEPGGSDERLGHGQT